MTEIKGIFQLLASADDVSLLGDNIDIIKKIQKLSLTLVRKFSGRKRTEN
jgi:hypothetical protein